MGTIKESSIVPINKSVSIFNRTLVSEGANNRYVKLITSESDSVKFSVMASSIGESYSWGIHHIGGSDSNHRTLLFESEKLTKQDTPTIETVSVTGTIEVTICFEGDLTFEMSAAGVRGLAQPELTKTEIQLTDADTQNQASNILLLEDIKYLLIKMNNHLRLITGMESTEGDDF